MENELTKNDLDYILGCLGSARYDIEQNPRMTIAQRYDALNRVDGIIRKIKAMKAVLEN
jgi:hypothetical protein